MAVIEPQIPQAKYPSFININELIFDAVMLVFVFILNRFFGPGQIKHTLSPMMITVIYLIFAYCLPWYMGIIYRQFEGYFQSTGRRVLLAIFGMLVLFIFISIGYCTGKAGVLESNKGGFMIMAGIVLLMMGCIVGGTYNPKLESAAEDNEDISLAGFIAIITLSILGFFCGISFIQHWHGTFGFVLDFLTIIMLFLGTAVVCIVLLTVMIYLKAGLIKLKLLKPIMKLKHFLLPFVLTTLLLLFNNLNLQIIKEMVQSITGGSPGLTVIIALIISGIIPFRIILLLTPPVRLINIGIGAIVFYLYIH